MAHIKTNRSHDLTALSDSEILSLHLVLSNARAWETGLANVYNAVESAAMPILAEARATDGRMNHEPWSDHRDLDEPPF